MSSKKVSLGQGINLMLLGTRRKCDTFLTTIPPIEWAMNTIGVYQPCPINIRYDGFRMTQLTSGPCENLGEYRMAARSDLPKSVKLKAVSFIEAQSELYPKLWVRTCSNAGSFGSHSLGQKVSGFLSLVHVFRDPLLTPRFRISEHSGRMLKSVVHGRRRRRLRALEVRRAG